MERKQEEKISFLTARQVRIYNVWLLLLIGLCTVIALLVTFQGRSIGTLLNGFLFGVLIVYPLFRTYRRIKPVEFDRKFLYVTELGFDILVPLDNIKEVEIKTLGGIYKVTFFDPIQSGREILFKPSLIYPLDFKNQDEKVNKLRAYAWSAKQNREAIPKNALTS